MNKTTLRLLLFTGLAAIFCASCSKDKDLPDIPDSYQHNGKPFSVEAKPDEGCDSLLYFKIRVVGDDTLTEKLKYPSELSCFDTLSCKIGDSIILEAFPKSGYTFINWVRNGKEISTQTVYSFKVNENDTITLKKPDNTPFIGIKHHYEARFGLDYALQVIPPIDSIIPVELIKAMGDYLYFGDTPPKIDFCFSLPDSIMLHTLIKANPDGHYNFDNEETWPKPCPSDTNSFLFERQHRCVAESHYYECRFYDGSIYYHATVEGSVFIMGHDDYFTAYFHQIWKPSSTFENYSLSGLNSRRESVIMSGKIGTEGIEEFQWGRLIESYDPADFPKIDYYPTGGEGHDGGGQPGINDIMIYSSDRILLYNPTFKKHFND